MSTRKQVIILLDPHEGGKEQTMILVFLTIWKLKVSRLQYALRQWTRPATAALALGALSDLTRTRAELHALDKPRQFQHCCTPKGSKLSKR